MAVACGVSAFAFGTLSHLVLDEMPHNNWIVHLDWFPGVPFAWLLNQVVCALPFAIMGWLVGRDHLLILGCGMVGGMYPDFEKVAYLDLQMPKEFVLFHAHSLKLSSNHGDWPFSQLVTLEVALVIAFVAGTLALASKRRRDARLKRAKVSRPAFQVRA